MGVADASFTFQRVMASILAAHHAYTDVYIDDVFISNGGRNTPSYAAVEEHITYIDEVLTSLEGAGARLGPNKTTLLRRRAEALGQLGVEFRVGFLKALKLIGLKKPEEKICHHIPHKHCAMVSFKRTFILTASLCARSLLRSVTMSRNVGKNPRRHAMR